MITFSDIIRNQINQVCVEIWGLESGWWFCLIFQRRWSTRMNQNQPESTMICLGTAPNKSQNLLTWWVSLAERWSLPPGQSARRRSRPPTDGRTKMNILLRETHDVMITYDHCIHERTDLEEKAAFWCFLATQISGVYIFVVYGWSSLGHRCTNKPTYPVESPFWSGVASRRNIDPDKTSTAPPLK